MPTNDLRDIVHDGVQPHRAAANLKVCDSATGGHTSWRKRKVDCIAAPMRNGAYARTIRIHELLHANNTTPRNSRKFPLLAQNAIEDARVHSVYWPKPMPRRADRDCLAAALRDLRTISPMAALGRAEDWNLNLLVALRCAAIFSRLASASRRGYRHNNRLQSRIVGAFGPIVAEKLGEILGKVRSRKGKALAEFTALMRTDDEQGGNGKGAKVIGKQTNSPMRIVRLAMPDPCNSAARRTALARSGARLNRSRMARAVANGSVAGLFIRQRYLPGGTYLFDASGSMGLSEHRLNELCRSVPAATIAYYSGWGSPDSSGAYGELVIYAESGRRAAACERMHGGNEVDLYAIQWLLRQPGPRVYVGDGGFCGGPEGQDSRAAALLASAIANGKVKWIKAIGELSV
jgi:hypothetical protein